MSLAPIPAAPPAVQFHIATVAAIDLFHVGGLLIAGTFAFLPGRIMHAALFGG